VAAGAVGNFFHGLAHPFGQSGYEFEGPGGSGGADHRVGFHEAVRGLHPLHRVIFDDDPLYRHREAHVARALLVQAFGQGAYAAFQGEEAVERVPQQGEAIAGPHVLRFPQGEAGGNGLKEVLEQVLASPAQGECGEAVVVEVEHVPVVYEVEVAAAFPQCARIEARDGGIQLSVPGDGHLEREGDDIIAQAQLAAEPECGVVELEEELRAQVHGIAVPARPDDASPCQFTGFQGHDIRFPLAQGMDGRKAGCSCSNHDDLHNVPPYIFSPYVRARIL